jgi:hypothetical protein
MVEHGDPTRRGADHGEAFGASLKSSIHRRNSRRKLTFQATLHHRKNEAGEVVKTWEQRALACSRIMQAWRELSVREAILHDPESAPYLQRRHLRLKTTGFATVGHAAAKVAKGAVKGETRPSIFKKMQEAREYA